MPRELRDELLRAAQHNGRSLNAEILARLMQASAIDEARQQNEELKQLLREVLDSVRN